MPGLIEIRDQDGRGFLTVELRDLLAFFNSERQQLIWSILDLEATADPLRMKGNLLEIERAAQQSPAGFILNWDELLALADSLTDVADTVIVGCGKRELIPRLASGQEIYASCEIVVEAIDSALWRIYARNDELIHRLRAAFSDVTVTQI